MMAEWLAYHKIIDDISEAEFTVQNQDGSEHVLRVSPVQFNLQFRWSGLNAIANDEPPVFTNPRQDAYTSRTLADGHVLYVQLNQCIDQPGRETAAEFAQSLERFLDTTQVDRCIVDLRNNDGGNDVFDKLLRVLRDRPTINRQGHLFVLIGRRTQSAAVRFATQLQMQTNALFLGEPTGQGPIFYGGPTLVELPHSGLLFGVSRHLAVAGLPVDHREAIEPDITVAFGIEDFRNGRDPVLRAALEYEVPNVLQGPRGARDQFACAGRYVLEETLVLDVHEEEGNLRVRLTDFLPDSRIRFFSELRRESGRRFATHIKNVVIDFPGGDSQAAPRAILLWMGTPLVFERTVADSVLAFELFSRGEVAAGCGRIRSEVEKHRRIYPDLERQLNRLGYLYLRGGDTRSALDVFHLNLELFPESYNVYDSYGEALMVDGKIDSAIVNYRRSLELNPKNANAARVIERLTEL
jgi:hypothetical protein